MTTASADTILLVLTNLPDTASARSLAQAVVSARLAACANILAGCQSIYQWEGRTERAEEIPVLLKTVSSRYLALEAAIRAHHPYEIPEILAFPAESGFAGYLSWVAAETRLNP